MQTSGRWPDRLSGWIGVTVAHCGLRSAGSYSAAQLGTVLQPGDVLLVEGNLRIVR
jgi:hypothetical protein